MGILYLFIKLELDRSTNDGDLLWDRNHWTDTQTESDNFLYWIKGRVKKCNTSCISAIR